MIRLITDRLIIRDHKIEDLSDYHILMSNRETLKYMHEVGTDSFELSKESLTDAIEQSKFDTDRERYFFGIFNKETKEYIGEVGFTILQTSPMGKKAELGYFILEKHWRKGYTYEAAKAVLSYALENCEIYKMISGCIAENVGSEKIMTRLGFTKEAHLKEHVYILDAWMDRVEYGLINTKYK